MTPAPAVPAPRGHVRAHDPDRGRADVLDLIHADHARIRRLLATVESVARREDPARARRILSEAWDRAADLLEADCSAEEEICYPELYRAATGAGLISKAKAEHDELREAVAEARLQDTASPAWWKAVTAVIKLSGPHFADEEHGLLAEIRHRTDLAQRSTLGQQWAAFMNARARDAASSAQ
jgi:hypothetical protein